MVAAESQAARERPILFSGPMVRAILAGQKTMTRRVVRPQPVLDYANGVWSWGKALGVVARRDAERVLHQPVQFALPRHCPYGSPGDTLWVRETWHRDQSGGVWGYYADHDPRSDGFGTNVGGRKVPSIHMPRWASRITLRVTGVRVERLQDISEEDADAEGVYNASGLHLADCSREVFHPDHTCDCGDRTPQEEFGRLWNSINGKRPGCSWADNPWVWAISFERVSP